MLGFGDVRVHRCERELAQLEKRVDAQELEELGHIHDLARERALADLEREVLAVLDEGPVGLGVFEPAGDLLAKLLVALGGSLERIHLLLEPAEFVDQRLALCSGGGDPD